MDGRKRRGRGEGGRKRGREKSFLAWFFTTLAPLLQVPPVVENVGFCPVGVFSKAREFKEPLGWFFFFWGGGSPTF